MAKNLKINIKNAQIAQAVNLGNIKKAVAKKKEESQSEAPKESKDLKGVPGEELKEPPPRMKARSRSAFADPYASHDMPTIESQSSESYASAESEHLEESEEREITSQTEEKIPSVSKEIYPEEKSQQEKPSHEKGPQEKTLSERTLSDRNQGEKSLSERNVADKTLTERNLGDKTLTEKSGSEKMVTPPAPKEAERPIKKMPPPKPEMVISSHHKLLKPKQHSFLKDLPIREKFGPTGKHVKDLLPPPPPPKKPPPPATARPPFREMERREGGPRPGGGYQGQNPQGRFPGNRPPPPKPATPAPTTAAPKDADAAKKGIKFKEYRDVKPAKKTESLKFDSRDRQGLSAGEEEARWRKKKAGKQMREEEYTIRPTSLKIRLPIALKDLAAEMKLKASQLIQKLFLRGVIVTLNDLLEDEITIQLLGQEFGCEIAFDHSEQERIRITDKTIAQEITEGNQEASKIRPPIVAFMGHVDHGKTSLIDYIRKSNRAQGEAGAITQHIGAFLSHTAVGDIAILDTPGHEAFSSMRARGANITDIVVLVVAGDEGIRQQTIEAIMHAKAAGVVIVVAINKMDKPGFNAENVYRQLSEQDLLPEAWGGKTITVNCSALTGDGIKELLEMLALQAEVLELKADPTTRARGTVIESEMHKGMGAKTTVLIQNGTLRKGDALVFEQHWGRIKTMTNEFGAEIETAGPSHPVEITGLSGLPEAGQEFIVVKNEKEAKEISGMRTEGIKQLSLLQKKKLSMDNLLSQASATGKKILNIVLRADVQGSLEALKSALEKIESTKADLNIIFTGVGEISESDVQLAAASKAVIIGFHTQIESHADQQVKELGVIVKLHDIIYHAIDDVKLLMQGLLDRISVETERGKALVKATFKSSHLGVILGCQVTEGVINRNHLVRIKRGNVVVHKGTIASLKKVKEDVREVAKGIECGILINNYNDAKEDDIIETYEITYLSQEL